MFRFSSCGKVGNVGPSQDEADEFYKNYSLKVEIFDGIQKWIVPKSGRYLIEAAGAAGVSACQQNKGGNGVVIRSKFNFQVNTVLYILVGQQGSAPDSNYGGAGGGASTVVKEDPSSEYLLKTINNRRVSPLIVAGGGGGSGNCVDTGDKQGTPGSCDVVAEGVGTTGERTSSPGAGFETNANRGTMSFLEGGKGGILLDTTGYSYGGFGSGGNPRNAGGGGGGFKGGNSGSGSAKGTGGNSYFIGEIDYCKPINTGTGYVIISRLFSCSNERKALALLSFAYYLFVTIVALSKS